MNLTTKEYKELDKKVYERKTEYPEGYTSEEIEAILKEYPKVNKTKFDSVLTGITCQMRGGKLIIYHCDVLNALVCGLENRDQKLWEWD